MPRPITPSAPRAPRAQDVTSALLLFRKAFSEGKTLTSVKIKAGENAGYDYIEFYNPHDIRTDYTVTSVLNAEHIDNIFDLLWEKELPYFGQTKKEYKPEEREAERDRFRENVAKGMVKKITPAENEHERMKGYANAVLLPLCIKAQMPYVGKLKTLQDGENGKKKYDLTIQFQERPVSGFCFPNFKEDRAIVVDPSDPGYQSTEDALTSAILMHLKIQQISQNNHSNPATKVLIMAPDKFLPPFDSNPNSYYMRCVEAIRKSCNKALTIARDNGIIDNNAVIMTTGKECVPKGQGQEEERILDQKCISPQGFKGTVNKIPGGGDFLNDLYDNDHKNVVIPGMLDPNGILGHGAYQTAYGRPSDVQKTVGVVNGLGGDNTTYLNQRMNASATEETLFRAMKQDEVAKGMIKGANNLHNSLTMKDMVRGGESDTALIDPATSNLSTEASGLVDKIVTWSAGGEFPEEFQSTRQRPLAAGAAAGVSTGARARASIAATVRARVSTGGRGAEPGRTPGVRHTAPNQPIMRSTGIRNNPEPAYPPRTGISPQVAAHTRAFIDPRAFGPPRAFSSRVAGGPSRAFSSRVAGVPSRMVGHQRFSGDPRAVGPSMGVFR